MKAIASLTCLRAALASAAKAIGPGGLQNMMLALGAAAVSDGVWRIYPPAGEIVAGVFAFALAWLMARAER